MSIFLQKRILGYVASVAGVLAVALLLWPFYPQMRGVTASAALLIVVLLVAITWGMGPALVTSLLGAVYLDFFYTPPLYKLNMHVSQGEDFLGLMAFLATSILVGQLSSRAQRRAREVQELYDRLHAAFDRASELEAIKRSERLKSALLDTVTHDLRTPLTSIKAAATALLDVRQSDSTLSDRSDSSIENLLGCIVQQSNRLSRFIDGMIELAQIESGLEQRDHRPELVQMEEIVGIALARAEDVLQNHEVIVECEDNLHAAIDPRAIEQVLFSLLENAGSYALPATTVRVIVKPRGPEEIQVAIEDEGPGVPEHLREKIFEKFFRSNISERRNARPTGLGLGLAIARGIVEAHGGKIWVEDRGAGKSGARFVFTVPAGKVALKHAGPEETVSQ